MKVQPKLETVEPRSIASLPRPVGQIAALNRLADPGSEEDGLLKLNRNERVQPLPEWFVQKMRDAVTSDLFASYPITDRLYRQLAEWLSVDVDRLLLTAGSDAAVKALYHVYLEHGDEVVMLDPSYAMYEVYAQMFGARVVKIAFEKDLTFNLSELLSKIKPGVKLVALANPNQPTGTIVGEAELWEIAEACSRVGALLAVDEAYYPFSEETALPLVRDFRHVVVIRTFSKAAGLAGMRVGYVVGDREMVASLAKVRPAHDVNSMAVLSASLILDHPEVVEDCVRQVHAGGRLLAERARALGMIPLPTHTNFMLIRVGHRCSPKSVFDNLRMQGILIKDPFRAPAIADCIRITLGPPAVMEKCANALKRAVAEITE